jgi:enoyl-CoA hydratase/carnithine racemase
MPYKYETLKTRTEGAILILSLARPEKMNAFTVEMSHELEQFFDAVSADDKVRVVIVTAEGPAFSAGMDLSVSGNVFGLDTSKKPKQLSEYEQVRDTGGRVALAIYRCTKPIIAAVQGVAVGVGTTMLLPMDFRLCSNKARFGFVFSRLGIVNEACSTFFLPKLVGLQQASDWLIRGHIFDAQEALKGGLVREVCEPDKLMDSAMKLAQEICENTSAVSIALIRQMLYRQLGADSPLTAHQLESLGVFYTSMRDGAEGIDAFRAKRTPEYKASPSKDMPPYYPWWDNK